ncbi:MAG TPA: PEP-utilizing enzyme, partial [Tepidiformaceae bacterium]
LWSLSRIAGQQGIEAAVRSSDFDPASPALPSAWRHAFDAFMARHGHRGLNEMEPAARTWRADPSPVVSVIRSYLDLPEAQSPVAVLERQAWERLRLTAELEGHMNRVKRAVFRWLLGQAQAWVALRERTKSIVVRAMRVADLYLPECQRRLVEAGVIENPDDVFFITDTELTAFLTGTLKGDLKAHVARRRREFERNRHILLPERFRGHPAPIPPDFSHHAGDVLTGTPVSPGIVTGRARVILDPAVDGSMQPGEILVAPVTDAGWTPLFALASGLVVDMGSALSHGSTVAREYGLPAVVNVRRGTRSIRTGDLITVNGSAGTVTILSEEVSAAS